MYQLDLPVALPASSIDKPSASIPAGDHGPSRPVSPLFARSLARTAARTRIAEDLRALANDLLGRPQPGELPPDCAAWLAATVDAAVAQVGDATLEALVAALDSDLASAPPAFVRRLEAAEARHDAGYL